MKDNKYVLNTALAVILFAVLLAAVLVRTFAPAVILPQPGIPGMVLAAILSVPISILLGIFCGKILIKSSS